MATHRQNGDIFVQYRRLVAGLLCALLLAGVGCRDNLGTGSGKKKMTLEEQIAAAKKASPPTPPDTPEQVAEKEAWIESELPEIYTLMDEAGSDVEKIDEVITRCKALTAALPRNRKAMLAIIRARLAGWLVKQELDENGLTTRHGHQSHVDIASASDIMDLLRYFHKDLTEDEVQLGQECYFQRARMETAFCTRGDGDALERFDKALENLMSLGFNDPERFKSDLSLERMFTDPATAQAMEKAVAQMEAPAELNSANDNTSEDEASPQPE